MDIGFEGERVHSLCACVTAQSCAFAIQFPLDAKRRRHTLVARWLTPALADTHACIGFLLAETQKGGLRNHPPRRLNCTPLQLIQPPPPQGEKINRGVVAAGD
jgi:hypothetical protein